MENLQIKTNPDVATVFDKYPDWARKKVNNLRRLIIETAKETESVTRLEETLKWGEPSYLTKHGSTIRIDWKEKTPDQYALYFKCTSKLIPTFKTVYQDTFKYEGDRAIVFHKNDEVPEKELKRCIAAGLTYHKVKKLPTLGLSESD